MAAVVARFDDVLARGARDWQRPRLIGPSSRPGPSRVAQQPSPTGIRAPLRPTATNATTFPPAGRRHGLNLVEMGGRDVRNDVIRRPFLTGWRQRPQRLDESGGWGWTTAAAPGAYTPPGMEAPPGRVRCPAALGEYGVVLGPAATGPSPASCRPRACARVVPAAGLCPRRAGRGQPMSAALSRSGTSTAGASSLRLAVAPSTSSR